MQPVDKRDAVRAYLILAAGPIQPGRRLRAKIEALRGSGGAGTSGAAGGAHAGALYVVCADGGMWHAKRLGLVPNAIVGDMDSAPPQSLEAYAAAGAAVIRAQPEKDETDVELALRLILDEQPAPARLLLVAPLRGRFDHALQNLLLMPPLAAAGWEVEVADGVQSVAVLAAPGRRSLALEGHSGDVVSLLPLSPVVSGVVTEGLRYPLRGEELRWGASRGVSNEVASKLAQVSIAAGALAVVRPGHP